MASNFDFLKRKDCLYDGFADACLEAEKVYAASPRMCAVACRRALELAIRWVYAVDNAVQMPYKENLAALIYERTFRDCVDPRTWQKLVYVQKLGNVAAHDAKAVRGQDAILSLRGLFEFVDWIDYCYGPDYERRTFDEKRIPAAAVTLTKEQAERILADHNAVSEQAKRIQELEAQLKDASERLSQQKSHNMSERDFQPEDVSEYQTRKRFIDLDLQVAGWVSGLGGNVAEEYEVEGMPNATGVGYVDYLLVGKDGRPLAVVEAKRTSYDPKKGLEQARIYCDCLERVFGYRPPFFLTNGFDIYYGDESSAPRLVSGFFSPDELQTRLNRRGRELPFSTSLVNGDICGRYYQAQAIAAVCEDFEQGARKALLVMATGTGKTRTAIGLVDVLARCNRVKNVLFLADRVALVNQAANAFKQHLPQVSRCNMCDKGPRDLSARVVLATYPSIMKAIDAARDGEGYRVFTPGHFDLVIIDEAHRSIFKKYQAIFQYFDALLVGLTATPAKEVDHNTYRFFDRQDGDPTYLYDFDTAVEKDHVLVPYVRIETHTSFLDDGITYADLSDEEKERLDEDFEAAGEARPDYIPEERINKWVFNEQTVDDVLQTLMDHGIRVQSGERLGKTIIFAASQNHARYIVERFDKLYPNLPPTYIKTVLNGDDYSGQTIADFEVADRMPVIAVSVDMLDTGVDVPEAVNLVFFKKVRSKIKFWQMIGRGTRLCPGLGVVDPLDKRHPGGVCEDKTRFFIFDWCRNFQFFGQGGGAEEGATPATLSERIFAWQAQLAYDLQGAEYAEKGYQELRQGLVAALLGQVAGLSGELFLVRQHRAAVERFREAAAYVCLGDSDLAMLQKELAPLAHYDEKDVDALRFDALMYGYMCAFCEGVEQRVRNYDDRLCGVARALQKKATIPQVRQALPLLQRVVEDDFLDGVTLLELEQVRQVLRGLVKFIDKRRHRPVFTDLADPVTGMQVGEMLHPTDEYADYRERVTRYLVEHGDNLVVHKLRHNEPLTEMDYAELGRILTQELGTQEDYERTFKDQPFGLLVRQVAGLDHQAAMEAFSAFVSDQSLNSTQIDFVRRVVDYVEKNGYMEPAALMQAPFDRPASVFKLFDPTRQRKLVDAISRVKANAEPPAA